MISYHGLHCNLWGVLIVHFFQVEKWKVIVPQSMPWTAVSSHHLTLGACIFHPCSYQLGVLLCRV